MTIWTDFGGLAVKQAFYDAKGVRTRVIEGGWTRSLAASAPGVIAPSLPRVARTESWVSDICDSVRRPRRCRVKRTTASERSLASARTSEWVVTK